MTFGEPTDARRRPWPNAVLGDGSLLLTFSGRGELEQLWWPHVDRDPNLGELRLISVSPHAPTWLDDALLQHRQRDDGDADVLVTEVVGVDAAVVAEGSEVVGADPDVVTITDVVAADAPVLLRRVTGLRGRLGVFIRPELGGLARGGGGYLDPATGTLVLHRRDRVLAIAMGAPASGEVRDGLRGPSVCAALMAGRLLGGGIIHGHLEAALLADAAAAEVVLAVAIADTHAGAIGAAQTALAASFASVVADRRAADAAVLDLATPPSVDGEAAALDRRSQLVLSRVTDRQTGGVIAAPEQDAEFLRSGGYGFVWARDLAFILLAELAAGRADLAVPALRWLVRAQSADGLWLQRHWTDATLGPSWGTQLDETGAVLVVYERAWQTLRDRSLDAELWPSAARAADALVAVLDPTTGLPAPSMDLWEERIGVHAYTAAAACAGLRAAAAMGRRHAADERAAGWLAAAERVRTGIDDHLWSERHGRYLRSIDVAREDAQGSPVPASYGSLDHPAFPVGSVDPVDPVVDTCLLGLAYPFGVIAADEPRMCATIAAVERELTAPDGGVMRYTDDAYEGGNPWVLTTLWLGLTRRRPGAVGPAGGVDYAVRARTSTGLLPEQVDAATGEPAWVVPLTWSHAMYMLAVRPDPVSVPSEQATRGSRRD